MRDKRAEAAHHAVRAAVEKGLLQRSATCELCGFNAPERRKLRLKFGLKWRIRIEGHHWRGYEYPLDVWWVCSRCNHQLCGKHDGSLTKEQARCIIRPFSLEEETRMLCEIAVTLARDPSMIARGYERMAEIGRMLIARMDAHKGQHVPQSS